MYSLWRGRVTCPSQRARAGQCTSAVAHDVPLHLPAFGRTVIGDRTAYCRRTAPCRAHGTCTASALRDVPQANSASSTPIAPQAVQLHPSCLWVRKLPWDVPQLVLRQALQQACPAVQAVHMQGPKGKQRGTAAGADHRGHAVLRFASAEDAEAAAAQLQAVGLHLGQDWVQLQISKAPTQQLPSAWTAAPGTDQPWGGGTGASSGGGAAVRSGVTAQRTAAQREHLKRNRQYKVRDRVQSLLLALQRLSPPGGAQVEAAYQQILPPDTHAPGGATSTSNSDSNTRLPASNSTAPARNPPSSPPWHIDWEGLPAPCQVSERGAAVHLVPPSMLGGAEVQSVPRPMYSLRVERKQAQVESFLLVLHQLLGHCPSGTGSTAGSSTDIDTGSGTGGGPSRGTPSDPHSSTPDAAYDHPGSTAVRDSAQWGAGGTEPDPQGRSGVRVVEFGSGSGNLLLPLAFTLPHFSFHAVDMKEAAVKLLLQRAAAAGLCNVSASVCRIEQYTGEFDVALALHACGRATDLAMLQAQRCQAAFICSPCCVGKIRPRDPAAAAAARAQGLQEGAEDGSGGGRGRGEW